MYGGGADFHYAELTDREGPRVVRAFQAALDEDRRARLRNQKRLRGLQQTSDVRIFCAHEASEFESCDD